MAKVLLVDDDPDFREMGIEVLSAAGHEVVTAASGKEGFEAALRETPDAAVIDLMMETVDAGAVLCRKLKNDDRTKSIPLLMLTAVTEATGFKFGIDTEGERDWILADEYVDKPIPFPELVKRVGNLLGNAARS